MTTGNAPVLIVTNQSDLHADAVVSELTAMKVPIVRWHPHELNRDSLIEFSDQTSEVRIRSSGHSFDLSDIRSVWFHRPLKIESPPGGTISSRLVASESDALLRGLYAAAPEAVWYSQPGAIARADLKPYQLSLARLCGFAVPPFIISNDVAKLRMFIETHDRIVVKPISEASKVVDTGSDNVFLFVRAFAPEHLQALLPDSPVNPVFLQAYVPKTSDVRVQAIGDEIFSVEITNGNRGASVDWRREGLNLDPLSHRVVTCPQEIRSKIQTYMKRAGINAGGFDFAVDNDGKWWFLECNPNGQWLWLELESGIDLTRAFAEHLALHRPGIC